MSWVLPLALVSEYRGWSVSAHAGREGQVSRPEVAAMSVVTEHLKQQASVF